VLGNFGACPPAVYGPGSLLGIAAKEDLKEFRARILRRDTAADVASADVVLADPEEKQTDAGGHDVVVLAAEACGRANPLKSFDDGLAVSEAGGRRYSNKKKRARVRTTPHWRAALMWLGLQDGGEARGHESYINGAARGVTQG
jgi:hypothetical protein